MRAFRPVSGRRWVLGSECGGVAECARACMWVRACAAGLEQRVCVCLAVRLRGQPDPGFWWPHPAWCSLHFLRERHTLSVLVSRKSGLPGLGGLPPELRLRSRDLPTQGWDWRLERLSPLPSRWHAALLSSPCPAQGSGPGAGAPARPAWSPVPHPPHPQPCMLQPLARNALPGLSIPAPDLSHIGIQLLWKLYRL